MAIAGDSHNIPSMPIKLLDGKVTAYSFTTNKAREIVEQDEERAALRLLAGERFEMWCSGMQIHRVQLIVDRMLADAQEEAYYAILHDSNLRMGDPCAMPACVVERCARCAVARLRAGGWVLVSVGIVERVKEMIGEKTA